MATSWNYMWGESWHEYLQRKTITNDLTKSDRESAMAVIKEISGQTRSILSGMASSTEALTSSFRTGFDEVIRSLEQGRSDLREYLDGVSDEISDLNGTLELGFGQILGSLGGMGDSLESLLETARTPTQTAAYEHFEIARDAFRQGLYPEALDALQKALHGDRRTSGYKLEWRFHRLIGVIRLGFVGCDMRLVNLKLAKEAFLLSARYAENDDPKEAARDLLQASIAAYAQCNLEESESYATKASVLDQELAEAWFQLAKCRLVDEAIEKALNRLEIAVELDPRYVLKAAADGEFGPFEEELNDFFSGMREEKFERLEPVVRESVVLAYRRMLEVEEIKTQSAVLGRWNSLLKGDWGLFDLLRYQPTFEADQRAIDTVYAQGKARIAKEISNQEERARLERKRQEEAYQAAQAEQLRLENMQCAQLAEAQRAEMARRQQEIEASQARTAEFWSGVGLLFVIAVIIAIAWALVSGLGVIGWAIVIIFGVAILFDMII